MIGLPTAPSLFLPKLAQEYSPLFYSRDRNGRALSDHFLLPPSLPVIVSLSPFRLAIPYFKSLLITTVTYLPRGFFIIFHLQYYIQSCQVLPHLFSRHLPRRRSLSVQRRPSFPSLFCASTFLRHFYRRPHLCMYSWIYHSQPNLLQVIKTPDVLPTI